MEEDQLMPTLPVVDVKRPAVLTGRSNGKLPSSILLDTPGRAERFQWHGDHGRVGLIPADSEDRLMATYLQLAKEPEWGAEVEAPAHAALNARLRAFFGLTKAECGSKGDNNHLRGRHRSRRWCLESMYCTNRTYGTTDARDKKGDENWLRASDVGIRGQQLQDASRRIDAAVRAGRLPAVAEWFGTFDGRTVVGWFEGHASSSDESHLYHLHLGIWTGFCNDEAQMQLLGDLITGEAESMLPIKKGTKSGDVEAVQRMLVKLGYETAVLDNDGKPIVETRYDGDYKDALQAAVTKYRADHKLASVDQVTPWMWVEMGEEIAEKASGGGTAPALVPHTHTFDAPGATSGPAKPAV
jgi:hypothetical protein